MSGEDDNEALLITQLSTFAERGLVKMETPAKPRRKTLGERRARENASISPNMRRVLRSTGETKNVQLNIKVTPSFKRQLVSMANARRISVTELIEQAVGAMANGGGTADAR